MRSRSSMATVFLVVGVVALSNLLFTADVFASVSEVPSRAATAYQTKLVYQDFVSDHTFTQAWIPRELWGLLKNPVVAMYAESETKLNLYTAARRALGKKLEQPTTEEIAVLALIATVVAGAGIHLGVRKTRRRRDTQAQTLE